MAEITREQTEELRGLMAKATQGPWKWDGDVCDTRPEYRDQNAPWLVTADCLEIPILRGDITGSQDADAALIVTMRAALPALLDITEKALSRTAPSVIIFDDPPRAEFVTRDCATAFRTTSNPSVSEILDMDSKDVIGMCVLLPTPSDPKPTSDLLSRLASAQGEASAQEWYGLGVLLHEAETAIRRLEQAKGGEENVAGISRNATSLGVTAEASEIEELCKRLEVKIVWSADRTDCIPDRDALEAAALIRRLVAERDNAHEDAYTTDDDGQSVTWRELYEAERSIRQYNQRRAAAAEAEIERLRAVLSEILDYEGGAATALEDEYVMDRAHAALEGKSDG